MPKRLSIGQGLSSILFWSIISAAFIGPGTVTLAAQSGADFRLQLLWALGFSILATISLQEAAARITIASGKSLGEIVAMQFASKKSKGFRWVLFFAVAFGCAAYQAGNLLGALAGLDLISNLSRSTGTLMLCLVCFGLLWIGQFQLIARLLGVIVALMGIVFISVALKSDVLTSEIIEGTFQPSMPPGSSVLIIGLIGTTIVPYNLFLASGITQGQEVREMRIGLVTAILIGGLISIAIMVVGCEISGTFSFQALAETLSIKMGSVASRFFGFGLFAAGLSSSITAPLSAAITGQSLLGNREEAWSVHGRLFRCVWFLVLVTGGFFGLMDVQPIPAIILAQALNGLLLPIVTVFLFMAVNDTELLSTRYANGRLANLFMLIIVGVTCFLGFNNIWKAINRGLGLSLAQNSSYLLVIGLLSFFVTFSLAWRVFLKRGV